MGCSNLRGSDKYPANVSFWGMCGLAAGRPTQPTVGRRTRVIFQKMKDWPDNIHFFFSISIRFILLKWFESVTFSQPHISDCVLKHVLCFHLLQNSHISLYNVSFL